MRAVEASSLSQPPPRNSTAMGKGCSSVGRLVDVLAAGVTGPKPGRELKQHRAELAGGLERRQRAAVGLPEQRLALGRQVAQIDVALAGGQGRHESLQVGREPLGRGAVAREEGERLDVEDETRGCAFGPELGVAGVRRTVEGGVDLDDGKLGGVEPQASGGARHARRVEAAGGDQRRVGPGAVADQDACRFGAGHRDLRQWRAARQPWRRCERARSRAVAGAPVRAARAGSSASRLPQVYRRRPAGSPLPANVHVVTSTTLSRRDRRPIVATEGRWPSSRSPNQSVGGALWRH